MDRYCRHHVCVPTCYTKSDVKRQWECPSTTVCNNVPGTTFALFAARCTVAVNKDGFINY